jgi:hypothetical protein
MAPMSPVQALFLELLLELGGGLIELGLGIFPLGDARKHLLELGLELAPYERAEPLHRLAIGLQLLGAGASLLGGALGHAHIEKSGAQFWIFAFDHLRIAVGDAV